MILSREIDANGVLVVKGDCGRGLVTMRFNHPPALSAGAFLLAAYESRRRRGLTNVSPGER